jgi:hypothetical protein
MREWSVRTNHAVPADRLRYVLHPKWSVRGNRSPLREGCDRQTYQRFSAPRVTVPSRAHHLPAPLQQADQPRPSALPWLDRGSRSAATAASDSAWSRGDEDRRGRGCEALDGSNLDRYTCAGVANQDVEPESPRWLRRTMPEVRARQDGTARARSSRRAGIHAADLLPNSRMRIAGERRAGTPLTGRDRRAS